MTPYPHQIYFADKCYEVLSDKGYVYLAGKPRSGKTYTAILTAEKCAGHIKSVLVLTKTAAIGYPKLLDKEGNEVKDKHGIAKLVKDKHSKHYDVAREEGWLKFITNNTRLKKTYTVTNYEQVGTFKAGRYNLKLDPEDYDLVIIDESHNLGTLGKPSNRIKCIRKLCWDMPHIHLSGTAIVESPNSIYHQMCISKWSPFRYRNFYDFFRVYGNPYYIKVMGRELQQYDKYKPELLDRIDEFTVYMTQEDAGIAKELQAVDKVHYVELQDTVKEVYNRLQKHNVYDFTDGFEIVCDSVMKLRTALHMLESGIAKSGNKYVELGNTEKVQYVKDTFGDTEDVGIMAHFVGERILLYRHFKNATIYSSNAHSEGVDLSHLKHFIIFSSDYSGSKFIQRRERIINTEGSNTLLVHHILVKKAISEQVYNRVSKKQDFNNSTYIREEI